MTQIPPRCQLANHYRDILNLRIPRIARWDRGRILSTSIGSGDSISVPQIMQYGVVGFVLSASDAVALDFRELFGQARGNIFGNQSISHREQDVVFFERVCSITGTHKDLCLVCGIAGPDDSAQ